MKPIQYILLILLGCLLILFQNRFRSRAIRRVIVIVIGGICTLIILKPDWANIIANKLGIGRGADLLIYLSFFLFLFLYIQIYAKLHDLELKITKLVRSEAISQYSLGSDTSIKDKN